MPPKQPKAVPKAVPRRRAAAAAASTSPPAPTEPVESAAPSNNDTSVEATYESSTTSQQTPQETSIVAPPKGRLDSLTSTSVSASTSRSGSAAPRPGLKFKPKIVARRSKEERQALESKYADVVPSSSVDPTSSSRGRGSSSRGPRGRGRGGRGGFSDRFKDPAPSTASGPFALGSVISTGAQKVMSERSSHRFQSHTQSSGFKFRQQHLRRMKADPNGEGEMEEESSSDESETERIDVELIGFLDEESQDEDGDQKMDSNAHWGAGAPIRIPRREHVDRQAMVNTDSSTKKSKAAVAQEKANEMSFEADIKIKDEPDDDGDVVMSDIPSLSSPETKKKVRMSRSPEARRKSSSAVGGPGASMIKRRRSSSHKKKPVLSTTEEKEEFERVEADRLSMLHELGGSLPEIKPTVTEADETMDMESTTEEPSTADKSSTAKNEETENQIFFFQFPTLLPELTPAESSADPDAAPSSPPTTKKPTPNSRAALKATLARLTAPPPSGHIGQLRVHRSGRITFLYGHGGDAFEMEVNRGANVEFLQEVVVMKEESPYGEDDKDEKGRRKGIAYSLGQVKGKYVVNPDFEKLIMETSGGARKGRRRSEVGRRSEGDGKLKMERRGSSVRRGSESRARRGEEVVIG
ncbi:hypothetical protein EX30DRAFT_339153 [Ascodesmis nigricans]|uniref:Uncharacterized protein n=1 Tax=Ascodesmis nigricans TaxID=341454 RepID=A0A4S2N1S7_9PEZI|nr:hypothetical protein EX30DRAFT_339153 [Ascodesmis nigricans]